MDKNTLIQFAKEAYALTLFFPKKEPLRWRLREAADEIISDYVLKQNDWFHGLKAQLETIDCYLALAGDQNWMDAAKIIDLRMQAVQIGRDLDWEKRTNAPQVLPEEKCFHMPAAEKLTLKEGVGGEDSVVAKEPEIKFQPVSVVQEKPAESQVRGEENDENETDDEGEVVASLTGSQMARQTRILEFLKEKGSAQVWEIQTVFPDVSKRTIRRDFRSLLKQGIIERTGERNTIAYKLKVNLS